MQLLLNACQATSTFPCGCCHNLLLHTVNVETRGTSGYFLWRRRIRTQSAIAIPAGWRNALNVAWPLSPRVKYDLAKDVIWRGPVLQLWQPPSTLLQSHCLSSASVSPHLSAILSILHTFSHLFSRSSLTSQRLFYWAALKPDVPSAAMEWRGNGNQMTCSSLPTQRTHFLSNLSLFCTPYPPFSPLTIHRYRFHYN